MTVGDSSRYFVVRVSDEKGERETLLGLGFRERDEAADFRAAISHYVNAVIKVKLANNESTTLPLASFSKRFMSFRNFVLQEVMDVVKPM